MSEHNNLSVLQTDKETGAVIRHTQTPYLGTLLVVRLPQVITSHDLHIVHPYDVNHARVATGQNVRAVPRGQRVQELNLHGPQQLSVHVEQVDATVDR